MTELPARRLLLVHAHPDDESINNGATMAKYVADGAHVALVTCTLGEEGEVIPPDLAHLAPDREDALGPQRIGELAAAMKELGVADHRFLGGTGRYRDSGMMGIEQNHRAGAFWSADLDAAAADLVEVIREVRPQVLVTYDPDGGYGHPDHIQAHRVAMRAADLAAEGAFRSDLGEPHTIAKIYWNRAPRSVVEERFRWMEGALRHSPFTTPGVPADVPGVTDDERITTEIDGTAFAQAKAAAMRAHATQIEVRGPLFVLSNGLAQPIFDVEYYELVRGEAGAVDGGRETDLFAGLSGAGLEGTGPEGTGLAGAGPEGAGPEGAGREGTGPEGAGREGAGREGVTTL